MDGLEAAPDPQPYQHQMQVDFRLSMEGKERARERGREINESHKASGINN